MTDKTTNFFEITFSPAIQNLFVTEIYKRGPIESKENIFTRLTKDSIISLYPLDSSKLIQAKPQHIEWLTKALLFSAFETSKSIFDIDYRSSSVSVLAERLIQREEFSVLRRLAMRIFHAKDKLILALDPLTKVYSRLSLAKLLDHKNFLPEYFLTHRRCLVFIERSGERKWLPGVFREITGQSDIKVKVDVPSLFSDRTIEVRPHRVIPLLNVASIASLLEGKYSSDDLNKQLKQLGQLTAKEKLHITLNCVEKYLRPLFPIALGVTVFNIDPAPLNADHFIFYQMPIQAEPEYIITRNNLPPVRSKQRLAGLSKISTSEPPKEHKVVLFATHDSIGGLENVVTQLNQGISKNGFNFSLPNQFGVKLQVTDKFIVKDYSQYEQRSDIFVQSLEEKHRNALALIYLPRQSDLYYRLKAKLAFHGKVSQVISQKMIDIYIAWNLGTNIFAKLGYQPWGISEGANMPNADIVLGVAYSSLKTDGRLTRNVAYANVFDKNGVWQFMQSSSNYFDFDKRTRVIPQLIRTAILGYLAGGTSPRIIDIHYSKRFSYQERESIFNEIEAVVPTMQEVNFISLDNTHPLRVFDKSNPSFNFLRGGIMQLSENEFLLSIAGENNPTALASRILKITVWRKPRDKDIDIRPIAYRILAMAKLNWRSAVRETVEPVTLKYAHEVARLTNQFSLTEWNTVNNQLSSIPWFI